ncbi:MAG: riboflavin synthase subunit alpha [Bacteroidia bacterium]|nr:MAG: riboflavin synthase subunit alpha [Bacteroidia bacterium]
MFSGIIEAVGTVQAIETTAGGRRFWIQAPFVGELSVGASIAHNGVCLSVIAIKHRFYCVEAVQETLSRTNLGDLELGDPVNLERSLPVTARLEGHLVQGHVDTTLAVLDMERVGGDSWYYTFELPPAWAHLVVEKGSIAIEGVSLTVAQLEEKAFRVAVIPWTYQHTRFSALRRGQRVNVEFDILAKYFWRWYQLYGKAPAFQRSS